MENKTWNAWIQISNRQDREFVFQATDDEVAHLRQFLANRENVIDFDVAEQFADLDVNDVKEELGSWISDEIE